MPTGRRLPTSFTARHNNTEMNFVSGNDQTQQPAPAFSLFFPGSRPNDRDHRKDVQKVIDDLHRKIGQLQVERDFLAGQPAISRVLRGGR